MCVCASVTEQVVSSCPTVQKSFNTQLVTSPIDTPDHKPWTHTELWHNIIFKANLDLLLLLFCLVLNVQLILHQVKTIFWGRRLTVSSSYDPCAHTLSGGPQCQAALPAKHLSLHVCVCVCYVSCHTHIFYGCSKVHRGSQQSGCECVSAASSCYSTSFDIECLCFFVF